MLNPRLFENTRGDGVAVLEVVARDGENPEQATMFVPLKRTELRGEIAGPLAALRVTHTYRYTAAECDKVIEAAYRFPLPGDAAVTGVRVRFGEVEIRAELKERAQAESDYKQAKEEGRQAALLTRESPDVFTLQVAGLQPDQDVLVETSYVQVCQPEGSGFSLRVPLTTSPRYVRSDELAERHAHGQPLALVRDPGHRFALDLAIEQAGTIRSATHTLDVAQQDSRARVQLQGGEVVPDRDLVLTWQPAQERDHPTLRVWTHTDGAAGQLYFLALVAPPAASASSTGAGVAREVVVLVDHSGSMEGAKWAAADWAVKSFLSDLNERDHFDLCLFHSTTRWFSDSLSVAKPDAVDAAIRFLEEHRDSGGTELGVALEQGMGVKRARGEQARHMLIITDAEVSDDGRILRLAEKEAAHTDRRRISVLCIDAAPNAFLARELAERGGGVAHFLTSNPQEGDITTALSDVLLDWSQPMLAAMQFEVNRPGAWAPGRAVAMSRDGSAVDLGDLPAGRSVWVVGRVPYQAAGGPLAFSLRAGGRELVSYSVPAHEVAPARPALKALYGASRVLGLEHLIGARYEWKEVEQRLKRMGYDPAVVAAPEGERVYAENTQRDTNQVLRALLVKEALDYGLACSETAFVAVRLERGKPIEGAASVPNALPSGWTNQFLSGAPPMQAMGAPPPAAKAMPSAAMPLRASTLADLADSLDLPSFLRRSPHRAMVGPAGGKRAQPAMEQAEQSARFCVVFKGVPVLAQGRAVLFDSAQAKDGGGLPGQVILTGVKAQLPGRAAGAPVLDTGLCVLIFVGDLAVPKARVRLADLVRARGSRPLNVARAKGEVVQVVLEDMNGAWSTGALELLIELSW
jgi:Ca-activated chloride channel homolog